MLDKLFFVVPAVYSPIRVELAVYSLKNDNTMFSSETLSCRWMLFFQQIQKPYSILLTLWGLLYRSVSATQDCLQGFLTHSVYLFLWFQDLTSFEAVFSKLTNINKTCSVQWKSRDSKMQVWQLLWHLWCNSKRISVCNIAWSAMVLNKGDNKIHSRKTRH